MLLYSTNTWLAHYISTRYYGGAHWVYCTPAFSMIPARAHGPIQPPSAAPKSIYWGFANDVLAKDVHSPKIAQNRTGLKKGALAKEAAGMISKQDAADIIALVDKADVGYFSPLLYVIPRSGVAARLVRVPPLNAASLVSDEYVLEELVASEFEALELH
jgi:hypothetical protein